ncbi:MAG: hypothetical protein AAGA62_18175, partial [Bacteroidota bacterium]
MHVLTLRTRRSVFLGLSFVAALVITSFAACSSDQLPEPMEADCAVETPTYTSDIKPIIDASCAY